VTGLAGSVPGSSDRRPLALATEEGIEDRHRRIGGNERNAIYVLRSIDAQRAYAARDQTATACCSTRRRS
jgi:hypothetical protein